MSEGKIRFNLKQISDWDRQNDAELKRKAEKNVRTKGFAASKLGMEFDHGYRDRALERRKDLRTDESQIEEIVSKLDAEQTKFLGGDIEHTHFVKGLDYALLQKVRKEKELSSDQDNLKTIDDDADNFVEDINRVVTLTALGNNLKSLLLAGKNNSLTLAQSCQIQDDAKVSSNKAFYSTGTSSFVKSVSVNNKAQILSRTWFEFNLDPLQTEMDIPLIITKSKAVSTSLKFGL